MESPSASAGRSVTAPTPTSQENRRRTMMRKETQGKRNHPITAGKEGGKCQEQQKGKEYCTRDSRKIFKSLDHRKGKIGEVKKRKGKEEKRISKQ